MKASEPIAPFEKVVAQKCGPPKSYVAAKGTIMSGRLPYYVPLLATQPDEMQRVTLGLMLLVTHRSATSLEISCYPS